MRGRITPELASAMDQIHSRFGVYLLHSVNRVKRSHEEGVNGQSI